ncbi:hypothetical protein B0T18DRAFT_314925 [Schizothecium vesticola]|uniref:Uncharacterized protein n=1 Tax=Schizothecium vesticola TaxID=314040 RepID=A0AA40KDL8_9PEZI|nr:hypothetical protein B0T18DRAFT_314925 [Schizothecium vesticola]
MAFHQPTLTRPSQQRVATRQESEDGDSVVLAPHARAELAESQTWVLFSPSTDAGTTTSYMTFGQGDQATPGRSRISELGSLGTAARSDVNSRADNSAVPTDFLEPEDDAELDSLDSHLSDFRAATHHYAQVTQSATVFPAHDGLGSFRLDVPGIGVEAQNQLYAFEKYNPNRVAQRGEGFELGALEMDTEEAQESERNRRIEAWRLEQSELLLEDIRKETKRRRQSQAPLLRPSYARSTSGAKDDAGDDAVAYGDWHDQDASNPQEARSDGLWSQMARKVICEVMSIDDRLLAILFGEALPDGMESDGTSTPRASRPFPNPAPAQTTSESSHESTWQLQVLERIAKELGQFVHRMSAHPGAFSAYARVQQAPLPYAGLPAIPEAAADAHEPSQKMDESVPAMPEFQPTVPRAAAGLGPPSLVAPTAASPSDTGPSDGAQAFTQQEWEQDLDIRLVFRYLRSHFTASRPSPPPFLSGTSHLATSSTQDLAAKAARIRQHHPLVSHSHAHHRPRAVERRKMTTPSSPVLLRHPGGSCASQSTRRSGRRSSVSSRHSSRHYWDIGGSIGTGSNIVASTGPMGSWGEV